MKEATRYKRMLLRQRRAGVWSIYQVKPDPARLIGMVHSAIQAARLVTDSEFRARVLRNMDAISRLVESSTYGIHVNRSNVCGYCELTGHSSDACPDRLSR